MLRETLPHHPKGQPRDDAGNEAPGSAFFEEGKVRHAYFYVKCIMLYLTLIPI